MSEVLQRNIRYLMSRDGIKNVTQLSRLSGTPQPTLFRWLARDAREPRLSSLKGIAKTFGVTAADLIQTDIARQHAVPHEVGSYDMATAIIVIKREDMRIKHLSVTEHQLQAIEKILCEE